MTTTVSGHAVPPVGGVATVPVPGTGRRVTLARWAAPLLLDLLRRWQAHPDLGGGRLSLLTGPLGGYNPRPARAGHGRASDHWGYAVDVRYDVLAADNREHMTRAENEAVRGLLADYAGAIAWGGPTAAASRANPGRSVGRYSRLIDEMHLYIAPGTTPARAQAVQRRLGIRADGTRTTTPTTPEETDVALTDADVDRIARRTAEVLLGTRLDRPATAAEGDTITVADLLRAVDRNAQDSKALLQRRP